MLAKEGAVQQETPSPDEGTEHLLDSGREKTERAEGSEAAAAGNFGPENTGSKGSAGPRNHRNIWTK